LIGGTSHGGAGVARIAYIVEVTDDISRPIFTQFAATFITLGEGVDSLAFLFS